MSEYGAVATDWSAASGPDFRSQVGKKGHTLSIVRSLSDIRRSQVAVEAGG